MTTPTLTSEPVTALGYVRVSTDEQETARQEEQIRAWATLHGVTMVEILREPEAASGRADAVRRSPAAALQYYGLLIAGNYDLLERSGYAELLRRLRERQASLVVFYALDRFSRDCLELLLLERVLTVYGVSIVSLSDGGTIDTRTANGKMLYRIRAAVAQFECDVTSERTSATLRHKVKTGQHVGRPPVGWRKNAETGAWEHDPETWPRVEQVHNLRAMGKIYAEISKDAGVAVGCIKSHLDAWDWTPPAAAGAQPGLGLAKE